MRLWWVAAAASAVAVGAAVAQMPTVLGRTDLHERFIATGKQVFGLLAPDLVAAPSVEQAYWSPDGRYLLLRQTDPKSGPQGMFPSRLCIWDRRAHRLDTVWRQPSHDCAIVDCQWLPATTVALVVVQEKPAATPARRQPEARCRLLRVSAASASARVLLEAGPSESMYPETSPGKAAAVIVRTAPVAKPGPPIPGEPVLTELHSIFQVVRADGSVGPVVEPAARGWGGAAWSGQADGVAIVNWVVRGEDRKVQHTRYVLDPATSRASLLRPGDGSLATEPAYEQREADRMRKLPIRLKETTAALADGASSRKVRPLWLETAELSERPRALVSANAAWSKLCPAGDAVLYVADGAAWVAPVLRMPRSAFDGLEREAAMQDAKRVGIAMRMYSQDYDDMLPLPEHVSSGAVQPYVQDAGTMDGFSYTYGGGAMRDITVPGETPLGYISGPGGRAIIFADGHVGWEPRK